MPLKTPLTVGASFGFHWTPPVSLKQQKYPSPEPTMARSCPVASPTTTAAEDSSRPLRTRRQPCGGGTPWHLAGLGSFPGGILAARDFQRRIMPLQLSHV